MPIYEFETADGHVVELYYARDSAPSIGDVIAGPNGERLTRIVSQVQTRDPGEQENFRLHSHAAPGLADVREHERQHRLRPDLVPPPVRAPAYDQNGTAVFRSHKELREYAAKSGGSYAIGNPKETRQEHVKAVESKRVEDHKAIRERERKAGQRTVK